MEYAEHTLTLNVHTSNESQVLTLRKGETGKVISVILTSGSAPYPISQECYAVLSAVKPDETILWNACTIEDGKILYKVTAQTSLVPGNFEARIRLYGGNGKLLCTPVFPVYVEDTLVADEDVTIQSADEITALTELIGEVRDVIASSKEATSAAQTAAEEAAEAATAAQKAASAVSNLESAVSEAKTAAGFAREAADTANEAASRADAALETSEQAVQQAAGAAADAQTAVTNAQTALQDAQEASANANAAAESTREALEEIRTVVDDGTDAPPIVCSASGAAISLTDSAQRLLQGLKVYGKTTQDGTPTPDAPVPLDSVGDGGGVTVTAAGKNLLQNLNGSGSKNDISYTVQTDGSVICTGTSTASNAFHNLNVVDENTLSIPPGDYIVSGGKDDVSVQIIVDSNVIVASSNGNDVQFTIPETAINSWCRLNVTQSGTTVNTTIYPMIRLASVTEPEWEPYKEPTTTTVTPVDGDGNALYLPGIPVTSGGNYTDSAGQQWVCDYIDFARGKYVQRIVKVELNGTETWINYKDSQNTETYFGFATRLQYKPKTNNPSLQRCSFLAPSAYAIENGYYPNNCLVHTDRYLYIRVEIDGVISIDTLKSWLAQKPQSVMYEMETPIEHDLTEAELAQYAAMHTNYPNSTLFNDIGAEMTAEYVADTKLYIDNKFTQLAAAIVSGT